MAKRRTELDRTLDTVKSMREEIQSWIGRQAVQGAWTFERILEWRGRHIYGHERWNKLPRWAQTEVNTHFEIRLDDLQNKLIWTHVLDGKRVHCYALETFDRARDIYEQNEALKAARKAHSASCYAFCLPDRRLMFVPFGEWERQKEMESGRLVQSDLDTIHRPHTIQLYAHHRPNGKVGLAKMCFVPVKDGRVTSALDLT